MIDLKSLLKDRFDAIASRILLVLNQLDDQQVNWRPNEASNSITNLIVHMNGNINDRIGKGMNNKPYTRNRDDEFESQVKSKQELIEMTETMFGEVTSTLISMTPEQLSELQQTGSRAQTNIEIFIQSVTHFSEHMGQILYIAKILKDDAYISTTVPKKSTR
ncbi:uncharacterized protein DUF1572 [Paenibacillus taihuensis]|uniref:Uncharacterized protein DUF1572 n=1 Tax=Paenibacillus taihuensis TaxID=1156355 RepID=A0A3D9R0N1_9BACL|nr:DUF1572 family protein [Paenibacillus taihuensis]REE67620.1 uncharacterized protein DUF1572 [Paenibacillus taihuensis]